MIKYSIIIPTYNDNQRTNELIEAILSLKFDKATYEVIVVDNNKNQQVFFPDNDKVNVLHCKTPGSYEARNYGVIHSVGEYCIFTDSDCIPCENWLKNIHINILSSHADVLAGPTKIYKGDSNSAAFLFERVIGFNFFNMKKNKVATTSNLIIKRDLIKKSPFNTKSFSGGDVEWTGTYTKTSSINYVDDIIVYHPARKDIKAILKKDERVYGGFYIRQKKIKLFFSNFLPPVTQISLALNSNESYINKIRLLSLIFFFRFMRIYFHFKFLMKKDFER